MYNNVLEYLLDKYNCLADMLSRNPVKFNNNHETCHPAEIESIFGSDMHVMISADEIKGKTANDEILGQLIQFVHQG